MKVVSWMSLYISLTSFQRYRVQTWGEFINGDGEGYFQEAVAARRSDQVAAARSDRET
jgi:hypothetical protein